MTIRQNEGSGSEPLSLEALKKLLHKQALAELDEQLTTGERAMIVVEGLSGQAFIVTNRQRVLVFKRGIMGGVAFGRRMHSWNFSQIQGIRVDFRIMNGYAALELIESSVDELSYWGHGESDVWKSSNAIPLDKSKEREIRESATALRNMVHDFHNGGHDVATGGSSPPLVTGTKPDTSIQDVNIPTSVELRERTADVRFCFNCGAVLRREGKYCESCGEKIV